MMRTFAAQAPVVIAGGGMAGLCAAVSALEQGAGVTVIEKSVRAGGSMWLSGGIIWTFRSKSCLVDELPDGNRALQELVVDTLDESLDWLQAQGVELGPEQGFQRYGRGRQASPAQMTHALLERIAS
ncbi:MAG: FAD-dependent oxidoreductase, partial [Gammaproteobacteria bacterium]|nr:FAD-dependent oxidoreductase [Gammaproteobacteria bacterium]